MMTKKRRVPLTTMLLFTIAIVLLLFTSIAGARAVLIAGSDANAFITEIGMRNAGALVLYENGSAVSGTLIDDIDSADGSVIPGKPYEESLYVANSGSAEKGDVDQYVRVVIYRYWKDADGAKSTEFNPAWIKLDLQTSGSGWIEDPNAKTAERTILYYTKPVAPGKATTAFSNTLMIDPSIQNIVSQDSTVDADGRTTTTTTFLYDGMQFCLEVEAEGVQASHAEEAILSAWGRSVSIAGDGTLSLK